MILWKGAALCMVLSCIIPITAPRPILESRRHRRTQSTMTEEKCHLRDGHWIYTDGMAGPSQPGFRSESQGEYTVFYDSKGDVAFRYKYKRGCYFLTESCKLVDGSCLPGFKKVWAPNRYWRWDITWSQVPLQCPRVGEQDKRRISGGTNPEDPKRVRPEEQTPPGRSGTADTSGRASGPTAAEGAERQATRVKDAGNECFMKHASRNPSPTDCGVAEEGELFAFDIIANQAADYSNEPVANEADLILARGDGIYHWEDQNLENTFVCLKHYRELGAEWKDNQPKQKIKKGVNVGKLRPLCNFPQMEGATAHGPKLGNRRVTRTESEALWNAKQIFVPLETAICWYHQEFLHKIDSQDCFERQGVPVKTLLGQKNLAESPPTPGATAHFLRFHNPQADQLDDPDYVPSRQSGVSSRSGSSQNLEEAVATIKRNYIWQQIKGTAKSLDLNTDPYRLPKKNFRSLAASTQKEYARLGRKLFLGISGVFAPADPKYFQQLVCNKEDQDTAQARQQIQIDSVMTRVTEAFSNAQSGIARQQALSLVAPYFRLAELHVYLPGLSEYYYKRARLFAKLYKPGVPLPEPDTKRDRVSRQQLETVIQFITSPAVITDLPYGSATVTSSTGEKEEIPKVLRNQINERIAEQYLAYMKETGQATLAVSRSTVLRILEYCPASTRKSLQGLDFFSWAGSEGFDTLVRITGDLARKSGDSDWEKDVVRRLREAKNYLKLDYKLHLKGASRIPDHCMTHALSDPAAPEFQKPCAHDHNLRCERCEALNSVLKEIDSQIRQTQFSSPAAKQEMLYDYNNAANDILELKKHTVRSVRQDQARTEILGSLQNNEVHILMDWAMKFLGRAGREPQADWFGKRGISWHITYVTARDEGGTGYRTRLYIHVFENVAQDAYAVLTILQSVLYQIKREMPQITHAYLRSDNAGCYKSAVTISAIPKLSQSWGVFIKRWDFSEAQAGKGPCDRASALVKKNVNIYAASQGPDGQSHRCTNAQEFVICADSYKGVKGATIVHSHVQIEKQPKPKIIGITQFNNFEFLDNGDIIVWRAYKIGPGKKLRKTWSDTPYIPSLTPVAYRTEGQQHTYAADSKQYWKNMQQPPIAAGQAAEIESASASCQTDAEDEDEDDEDPNQTAQCAKQLLFPCPEPGCTKTYQSQARLDWHLENGKHTYKPEKISLRDAAIGAYKQELEGLRLPENLPSISDALQPFVAPQDPTSDTLEMGWALRTRRRGGNFDPAVRAYLTEKFNQGAVTGRKCDPKVVEKSLRQEFADQQDIWVTWRQIASFWSRLARLQRQETLADLVPEADDDEQHQVDPANTGVEEDLQDDPYFNNPEIDLQDAIEENESDIFLQN